MKMRKKMCLLLIPSLLAACSKNTDTGNSKNEIASIEKSLQGKWKVTSNSEVYYDDGGTIIWHTNDEFVGSVWNIQANIISMSGESVTYSIDSANGTTCIIANENDGTKDTSYISVLTKSKLELMNYYKPDSYEINNQPFYADHSIYTIDFEKQ